MFVPLSLLLLSLLSEAGHPSKHALASGPNLDETNGRNLDKCTDETNNVLLPEGWFFFSLFFLEGLGEWGVIPF